MDKSENDSGNCYFDVSVGTSDFYSSMDLVERTTARQITIAGIPESDVWSTVWL